MKGIYCSLILLGIVTSCTTEKTSEQKTSPTQRQFIENTVAIASKNYSDAYQTALTLEQTIQQFLDHPGEALYAEMKKQWRAAHDVYSQTEVFRFQNGPIDDEVGPEPFINAWPLDESYIEYDSNYNQVGILNDTTLEISKDVLKSKNESGGEKNISVGFHAIEFLIWGPDFKDPGNKKPGQRTYQSFVNHPLYERRKKYLLVVSELLTENIEYVADQWRENGAYRKSFLALSDEQAMQKILTGMYMLSKDELAGERMYTALSNADQEDEQSCFSDHTTSDIRMNALGIMNLVRGSYKSIDGSTIEGVGLQDILEEKYTFEETFEKVKKIPHPFDNALLEEQEKENGPILTAVIALQEQGDFLEEYLLQIQQK